MLRKQILRDVQTLRFPTASLHFFPTIRRCAHIAVPFFLLLTILLQASPNTSDDQSIGSGRRVLATADFDLIGLAVTVEPAHQDVPKHTATAVLTRLGLPGTTLPPDAQLNLNPNYRVRGELTGPSLSAPLTLEAAIGDPLSIPPLSRAGDHVVQNLRLIDAGLPGAPVVAEVVPDSCTITVLDQLLVSEVQVHELTYDEILSSGLNINRDSYSYYAFTLALGTTSLGQKITIPVALPRLGVEPIPLVGTPNAPVGQGIPVPDVLPVLLTPTGSEGSELPNFELEKIRIPGLIVFPGRIGLLHQFFEAVVIVTNGAPLGTPLVVSSLRARISLPQKPNPLDNPLQVAELQVGGRVEELTLHGLGADEAYGTGDDTNRFSPGDSGQASFLIEGLKEGLHTVRFELKGTVEGLPVGPVAVEGEVSGAVLVRDGRFAVSFTHPSVVRAGQEYQLSMTLLNSGNRDLLGVYSELLPASISGADLLVDPQNPTSRRDFPTTIKPGDSGTIVWKLRARVTGAVTASYTKVEGAAVALNLVTGVGDRNVPLSPESLILPDPVKYLPSDVVDASRNLLGQAWSIATAPSGTLPAGVLPVSKQTVFDRAVELGVAGLRVRFGESLQVSLVTLLRDWLGEAEVAPDEGFADTIGATSSGYAWFDSLGSHYSDALGSGLTVDLLHRALCENEMARSRFVSAFVTQTEGSPLAGVRFVGPDGRAVGMTGPSDRFGALGTGAMLRLDSAVSGQNRSRGRLLLVSTPDPGRWFLELYAWQSGSVDVSLVLPVDDDSYRSLKFSNVPLVAGGVYRITFDPYSSSSARVEQCSLGACTLWGPQPLIQYIDEKQPAVLGAVQVAPAVLDSGDRYGRLIAVLFSKPMSPANADKPASYRVGGGSPVGSVPPVAGGPIEVTEGNLGLGNRFAILGLSSPIGPFFSRTLSVSSLTDTRGLALSPPCVDRPLETTVSPDGVPPAGFLTGRVLNGDGTPVANALVTISVMPCELWQPPLLLSRIQTDAGGNYVFEYVINGDCSPVIVSAVHPVTGAEKELSTPVSYHGQHLVMDLVFLARGAVQGTVTLGGAPVNAAYVRVMPDSDPAGGKLLRSDSQGRYVAFDIPVGRVSVFAAGSGSLSNATGFSAGWIDGPGQTTRVDVSLQNISGSVSGRIQDATGGAIGNMLVFASAVLPGLADPVYVGFCYSGPDGEFRLEKLPVTSLTVEAVDEVTSLRVSQLVQLTPQAPVATGLILALPGFGAISGRVTDQDGRYIGGAEVTCGSTQVLTDVFGYFSLPIVPAGSRTVRAVNPETGLSAQLTVLVNAGQTTANINLVIKAAATIKGTVLITQAGVAPVPLVGGKVTHDGRSVVDTDSQGAYILRNIPPGENFILRFVDATGRLAVNQAVRLNPGETLIRNVTFHPAGIGGRVFQPDGQTGAVARVELWVPRPNLTSGENYGLLELSSPVTTLSSGDGSYLIRDVNPADYRITAYNDFFPTRVSRLGRLAGDSQATCNLTLVDTLAGAIHGHVYKPDGTTPAGPGIWVTLGGGTLADARIQTDDAGEYRFPDVFATGTYSLTAEDPKTGFSNRIWISIEKNKDAIADIRLLGRGAVQVAVVDATGAPVESGTIEVSGVDFPNTRDLAELFVGGGGHALFEHLPEGPYAITASRQGLSGRVSAVVADGGIVAVTVKLQPSGTVSGQVLLPDGSTPAELADVRLIVAGKTVGYCTSSDDGTGSFSFASVPVGDFKLEAFDNRSTRMGRTAGRVTQQGQEVSADITLLPVGTVRGQVTANSAAVDHALVTITAGESGFSFTYLKATTDSTGSYRFSGIPVGKFRLSATHPAASLTGSAEGVLEGITEPIPDKVVNITLESSASLAGFIYDHEGTPVAGAQITVRIGSRTFHAASRQNGSYRVDYVPLGEATIRAEAPVGFDRGETGPVSIAQAGATVTANVTFNGTGIVKGDALDSDGTTRLTSGTVTFTNVVWSPAVVLSAPVVDGRYELEGVPAGDFSLKLAVPGRVGVGSSASSLAAGQTLTLNLKLEPAGTITGRVLKPDGVNPAVGVDITAVVTKADGTKLTFVAHTNGTGHFRVEDVPLGTVAISVSDPDSDAIGLATGLSLSANGQLLDVPIVLDDQPIAVVSVSPANGALKVSRSTTVLITFSEPAKASTVTNYSFRLLKSGIQQPAAVTLSQDGLVATLTPTLLLDDEATFTVSVSTQVADRVGHRLASEFRSTFSTPDEKPPVVTSVQPADGSTQVPVDAVLEVNFSEELDPNQSFTAGVIRLAPDGQPEVLVPLDATLETGGKKVLARPSSPLADSMSYRLEVRGQCDLAGNIQTAVYSTRFSTVDITPPVIEWISPNQTVVSTQTPTIEVHFIETFSGVDLPSIVFKVDGQDVRASIIVRPDELVYLVPASAPLSHGPHTVEAQISDRAGNVSEPGVGHFTVDDTPPEILSFTIGGVPASSPMTVTVSRPIFQASYRDNSGTIDYERTLLRMAPEGSPLTKVSAFVGWDHLDYQPATDLAEGVYLVELLVVDKIGHSVSSGQLRLSVHADSPLIQTIGPLTGSQHGGNVVVIEGSRLLDQDGEPPVVRIGANTAYVLSIEPGSLERIIVVTPPGPPGPAAIELENERGLASGPEFFYQPDSRTPLAVEGDTILLWHLDEPWDGEATIVDSGPFAIHGVSDATSLGVPGRFAFGRSGPVRVQYDDGSLCPNASSFTAELWLKTQPVTRTFLLVGKQRAPGSWGLSLSPSGSLRAWFLDNDNVEILAETDPGVSVVDDAWHHVAVVLDRELGSLLVYVDGTERTVAALPVGLGEFRNEEIFAIGDADQTDNSPGPTNFPGVLDEVRLSATAHPLSRIIEILLGQDGPLPLEMTYASPRIVRRGLQETVDVHGYNLENIHAEFLDAAGSVLPVTVSSRSALHATVTMQIPQEAAVGVGALHVTGPRGESTYKITVLDPQLSMPQVERDTVMLWHFEGANDAGILDDGLFSIPWKGWTGGQEPGFAGLAASGHIGTRTLWGELNFGRPGFTVECWFKASPGNQPRISHGYNFSYAFSLETDSSGLVSATVEDANNVVWRARTAPFYFDTELQRTVPLCVDDAQWHHVALTVDFESGWLKLFIDGVERASAPRPEDFGQLKGFDQSSFGMSNWSGDRGIRLQDELRISHTPHTAEQIWNDFAGNHPYAVTAIVPVPMEKCLLEAGAVNEITAKGYDLDGLQASIARDGNPLSASVSVIASSFHSVKFAISPDREIGLGSAELILSKQGHPSTAVPVELVSVQPFLADSSTVLLWHLNEEGDGAVNLVDSGPIRFNGRSGSSSKSDAGRFLKGRRLASLSSPGVDLSTDSFTVELWLKVNASALTATSALLNATNAWSLYMLPSGEVGVWLQNQAYARWAVKARPIDYSTGSVSKTILGDNKWHLVTVVVDRENSRLSLYADGSLRAVSAAPDNFGPLNVNASFLTGPFPGTLDEIRVSMGARSAEDVAQAFNFRPILRLDRVLPDSVVRDRLSTGGTATDLVLQGQRLDCVAVEIRRNGQPLPGVTVDLLSTTSTTATVRVTVAPQVTVGPADVVVSDAEGAVASERVFIVENRPFALESDTVLLWHLDEPGQVEMDVSDAARFGVKGHVLASSIYQVGKFGGARTRYARTAGEYGVLSFGPSSFTVECWVKTPSVSGFPIFSKSELYQGAAYSLYVTPDGTLTASVNDGTRTWQAVARPYVIDSHGRWRVQSITDNQWHYLAMVVDRELGLLRLYVDGMQKAESPEPTGFTAVSAVGSFRLGSASGSASTSAVFDEVRVSSLAHSPVRIAQDYWGYVAPSVSLVSPAVVARGTQGLKLSIHGVMLAGATVEATSPSVQISAVTPGPSKIDLTVSVLETAIPGPITLIVIGPDGSEASAELLITAPNAFTNPSATDLDTLLLWHLDETSGTTLAGSGDLIPTVISGTAASTSVILPGRFGKGRAFARIVASASLGAYQPVNTSFTLECWIKTGVTGIDQTLLGKVNSTGESPDYSLKLLSSRALQAEVYDTAGKVWRTTVPLTAYNPLSRSWSVCITDDNEWHLLSMVVNRTVDHLQIYVDGELRGFSAPPVGFGGVRNLQLFRAGLQYSGAFPGTIDEIRLLKGARSQEAIRSDFGLPSSPLPPALRSLSLSSGGEKNNQTDQPDLVAIEPPTSLGSAEDLKAVETQTVLLWRLDEPQDGVVRIEGGGDAGQNRIGGSSGPDSISQPGRWSGGRQFAAITGDPDGGALDLGRLSFTIDFWLKTDPVGRTYTLVGRSGPPGQVNDFSISISPAGSLAAWLADSKGDLWSLRTAHAVDTGQWTRVSLVVDRGAGWMSLWIDGEEVATEVCPEGFGALRNSGEPLRAGWVDPWGPATFGGPSAFPGVLDEIRFSLGALPASRIWTEFSGMQ